MTRIRQQNVTAAQWSSNGESLGAVDLTLPENEAFGANVFSTVVQRERLPGDVFEKLQATLAGGEALDREVDAVMEALAGGPFIFNLGHGILPPTPIAHVERMLKRVRG